MDKYQEYVFVDKTGNCFDAFRSKDDGSGYNNMVSAMLKDGRTFEVGDMLAFRDDLTDAGFVWDVDFYVKKVDSG